jgi:hypothetical protein
MAVPSVAARAQDLGEAERLFREGVALSEAERWGEAAEYFRRAQAIAERPSITCNLGVALYHLGEAREATTVLERCIALSNESGYAASHPEQIQAAQQFLDALRSAVGTLRLEIAPADATFLIDGDEIEGSGSPRTVQIDPGRHSIAVSAPGHRTHRTSGVSVLSGATVDLAVTLEPLPARPATLVVESLEGARILVDGELAGLGRIEEQLPASTLAVRVEVAGHEPLERTVTLAEGERVMIDASFRSTTADVAAEPWFWSVIGVSALAIAGAIVLGVVLGQPQDPLQDYGGTAGYVFTPLSVAF